MRISTYNYCPCSAGARHWNPVLRRRVAEPEPAPQVGGRGDHGVEHRREVRQGRGDLHGVDDG